MNTPLKRIHGYLAEFKSVSALYQAAEKARDFGFRKWDVHSPFPIHGMDKAMGLGRSRLPYVVIWGGAAGLLTAFLLQYITQVIIYPTVVQGKPANIFTIPAFFPVMFELTVLCSAFTTLFGLMIFMRMPRLHHPLFDSKQFHRFSNDAFFMAIEAGDPKFSVEETKKFLEEIGGENIELVEEIL